MKTKSTDPSELAPGRRSSTEMVAYALETEAALLPLIPELLADFNALGSDPQKIVGIIRELGLGVNARIVDLGSGKGAVTLAVSSRWGGHGGTGGVRGPKKHREHFCLPCFLQNDLAIAVSLHVSSENWGAFPRLRAGRFLRAAPFKRFWKD
jgi:hypothetical protein